MKKLDDLNFFLKANHDNTIRLTKLRKKKVEEMGHSGIDTGQSFAGQVTLREYPGGQTAILVDGGYTARTSPIKDCIQKSRTKWLIKTMNSIYKLEVV